MHDTTLWTVVLSWGKDIILCFHSSVTDSVLQVSESTCPGKHTTPLGGGPPHIGDTTTLDHRDCTRIPTSFPWTSLAAPRTPQPPMFLYFTLYLLHTVLIHFVFNNFFAFFSTALSLYICFHNVLSIVVWAPSYIFRFSAVFLSHLIKSNIAILQAPTNSEEAWKLNSIQHFVWL